MQDPPALRRATALVRVVDPSLPSNRFAVLVTAVTLAVVLAVEAGGGGGIAGAVAAAVRDAVAVFLAWALGRELDPDRARTARYAAFGAVALLFVGTPHLAGLLALLVAIRVLARPTGLHPTALDLAAAVVVAGVAARTPAGLPPALLVAGALMWDTRLPVRATRSSGFAGLLAFLAAVMTTVVGDALTVGWTAPAPVEIAVVLATMAAASQTGVTASRSRADATREPRSDERLRAARVAAAVGLATTLVWVGGTAVGALGGGWSAFVATGAVVAGARRKARSPARGQAAAPYPRGS